MDGRLTGVAGAVLLATATIWRKVLNILTTLIVSPNLGHAGKNVKIHRGIYYQKPSQIFLGNNIHISRNAFFHSETSTGKFELCDGVQISENCRIDFSGGVKIGKNSLISHNVIIETHDHGFDPRSEPVCSSLDIGENVWIGMNSKILSNVRQIGDNAVIGIGICCYKICSK